MRSEEDAAEVCGDCGGGQLKKETNVKGRQSHFSMPFDQKGSSPVRSCLIASRGSHMIWDSATCGVAVSWR
jgi:hypothetical protein